MKKIQILWFFLSILLPPIGATSQLDKFLERIEAKDIRLLESESN